MPGSKGFDSRQIEDPENYGEHITREEAAEALENHMAPIRERLKEEYANIEAGLSNTGKVVNRGNSDDSSSLDQTP